MRALKAHGGGPALTPGTPLPDEYRSENLELLRAGVCNMVTHIENLRKYGVNVVVCCNRFASDTDAEIEVVVEAARAAGAFWAGPR